MLKDQAAPEDKDKMEILIMQYLFLEEEGGSVVVGTKTDGTTVTTTAINAGGKGHKDVHAARESSLRMLLAYSMERLCAGSR